MSGTGPFEIVIATGNPHKVEEMSAIFGRLFPPGMFRFAGLSDLGVGTAEPEETGTSFEENARIKAVSYARQTGRMCLADDSGLEIDALGGGPGVISSHYCTDGREEGMSRAQRDAANNQRVLRELEGVEPLRRTARFVCTMCLAGGEQDPRRILDIRESPLCVRGTFEGRIGMPAEVPRGTNGFGYDPLFLIGPAFTSTSAELSPGQKNSLSHRAAAARLMAEKLRALPAE